MLEKTEWKQVREQVHRVNPELAEIIDQLDPGKDYPLYKGTFPYGFDIVKNGVLHVVNSFKKWVPITDNSVDPDICGLLSYNSCSNPVSLCLKNSYEIYCELPDRVITIYGTVPEGALFSTWVVLNQETSLHPAFLWNISSGARTIFMLPKVSESGAFKRLRKDFDINAEKPKNIWEHWYVFKDIANSNLIEDKWESEILWFTKPWFDKLADKAWMNFHFYMLKKSWASSEFYRNKIFWDLIYAVIKQNKGVKVTSYIENTVKHILSVAIGAVPGFNPAHDESAAPIHIIQKAYTESYRIKYPPVIMQPSRRIIDRTKFIYSSLQVSTPHDFSQKGNLESSMIGDEYEVMSLLRKYVDGIMNSNFNVEQTKYYEWIAQTKFDFYHANPENYSQIKSSSTIIDDDPAFTKGFEMSKYKNKFPKNSVFFRGCVRIS